MHETPVDTFYVLIKGLCENRRQ